MSTLLHQGARPEKQSLLPVDRPQKTVSSGSRRGAFVRAVPSTASGNYSADGAFAFIWNNRPCIGNALHEAAINNDRARAEEILDQHPELLSSRFTYETFFNGLAQEGSGEAIHLAASRDSMNVVRCLLERRASLASAVTRDCKAHYDVLHAAVFAEGRGGSKRMVRLLIEQKADIAPNLDGKWPLHLAFQAGKVDLIHLLRDEMDARGVLENAERDQANVPSPLKVGIQMRKLSEEQLSEVAALTPESLLALIHHEPKCIPSFLKRMETEYGRCSDELAKLVKVSDLAKVLFECAEAADALITALMDEPRCESEGWHPLPSRISFAPRTFCQQMQDMLNPQRESYPLYEASKEWQYDTKNFKAPTWHAQLTDRSLGRPIRDVRIRVCKVPNIVCAEFLGALCHAGDDNHLFIFENKAVHSVLEMVWWHGAIKVDFIQVALSIWGLLLLVFECWLVRLYGERASDVACDFICARGLVDIGHELVQFAGFLRIGRVRDYLDWGNAFDIFRGILPAMLMYDSDNKVVRVLVILLYWMRLLEVNFSESMSRELLPIMRLARGLLPAMIVAFVGFCGLTHAFYALDEMNGREEGYLVLNSFSMLITGEIPEGSAILDDRLGLFLTYSSILMFTVFFLNIFIGVIGENYHKQKDLSSVVFQNVRADICYAYMLRASVIPAWLCSPTCATFGAAAGAFAALGLQYMALFATKVVPHLTMCFAICQMVMVIAAYQSPNAPWTRRTLCTGGGVREAEDHYLWSVEAVLPKPPTQLDEMQQCLTEMRQLLDRGVSAEMSPGGTLQTTLRRGVSQSSSRFTRRSRTRSLEDWA